MHNPLGNRAALMLGQGDRVGALDIDQQFPLEDEEELVLFVVLMPMEISINYPQADHGVVYGGERLVEPGSWAAASPGTSISSRGPNPVPSASSM